MELVAKLMMKFCCALQENGEKKFQYNNKLEQRKTKKVLLFSSFFVNSALITPPPVGRGETGEILLLSRSSPDCSRLSLF